MMDSRPFFSLSHILADLADERVWVYAELVDPTNAAAHRRHLDARVPWCMPHSDQQLSMSAG